MSDLAKRAHDLHFGSILVDGHADTIGRAVDGGEDLTRPTKGHIDVPKMRKGGLDAQFFACWIEPKHVAQKVCVKRTLDMIDALRKVERDARGKFVIARTAADIRRAAGKGIPAGVACIEGGHAIEDDLAALRIFAELGVRYMTLTWNNSTNWADACGETPRFNGLSAFGREVVREMNRTGIMVDLSHVHEVTFWAAIETTRKPVIVSHSCARALCDHRRNLWDPQLRAVAKNKGVVCVNFYSGFVGRDFRARTVALDRQLERDEKKVQGNHAAIGKLHARYDKALRALPRPTFEELLAHIDHIARVAGVDHVGLGSDFDGVSSLPERIDDCTQLPRITAALLERGYSARDVKKILGENVLRVMAANEP